MEKDEAFVGKSLLFPVDEALLREGGLPCRWLGMLYEALDEGMRILRAREGSIMLVDRQDEELGMVAARGLPASLQVTCRLRRGEGMAGWAWEHGRYVLGKDVLTGAVPLARSEREVEPSICFPLLVGGAVEGVLNLGRAARGQFIGRRALELVGMAARNACLVLENYRLAWQLEEESDESIHSLLRALGTLDRYTRQHSLRVTYLAIQVGREMGFSGRTLTKLRQAGLVHDIGKIGVPGDILRKEGRLSVEEVSIIQQHPLIGARILGHREALAEVARVVLHHHERYDGTGYPYHLRGEAIPLLARVIAAADAFEAMTSNRPYRRALPPYLAAEELQRGAGGQFDPQVVRTLLAILEKRPQTLLGVPAVE